MAISGERVESQPAGATSSNAVTSIGLWQRKSFQRVVWGAFAYVFLMVAVCFLLPLLWMFSTSLKPDDEVFVFPPLLAHELGLQQLLSGLDVLPFTTYLINTCIVTFSNVLGNLIVRWRPLALRVCVRVEHVFMLVARHDDGAVSGHVDPNVHLLQQQDWLGQHAAADHGARLVWLGVLYFSCASFSWGCPASG